MNPVLFIDDEPVWRGGQDSLAEMLLALQERGLPLLVAAPEEYGPARRFQALGIPCRTWSGRPRWLSVNRFLARTFREIQPAAVVFNTPRPLLPALAAAWLTGCTAPRILYRRVCFPLGRHALGRLKYRSGIGHFIAISRAVARQIESAGIPEGKIIVLPESIHLERFDRIPPVPLPQPPAGLAFGCLAALTPEKGVDHLLAAFLIHQQNFPSSLYFMGEGPLRPFLEQAARRAKPGTVHLLGFREDFAGLLKNLQAMVIPSLSEGFSRAALYAMAARLPVIGARTGGIPEAIAEGETGLLFPPGDTAALAATMDRLAACPQMISGMGSAGRHRAARLFRLEDQAARLDIILRDATRPSRTLPGGSFPRNGP